MTTPDDVAKPARHRALKVGLMPPIIGGVMAGADAGWADLRTYAQTAEAVGFDSLWFPDHLVFRLAGREHDPVGMWESTSVIAAVAAVTSRIGVGSFVANTGFRNPALLAKTAVTIDEISGGRFTLGLGAGWHEPEYTAFGYPFDHRAGRFEEAFTIIRGLIQDGAIDFSGTYHTARDCELIPRGPRGGDLPLLIGSNGPRVLRIAAPHVHAWNSDWTHSPNEIPVLRALVDAACEDVGRDPATLRRTAGVVLDLPIADPAHSSRASTSGATAPGIDATRPASGDEEALAELLLAYAAEGIDEVQLSLDPNHVAGVEWFGKVLEVLDRA